MIGKTAKVLVLLLAVSILPALQADETSAKFFAERGLKACQEKRPSEAKEHFEKALDEMDGYLPALLGLARVAIDESENPTAIDYLTACVRRGLVPQISAVEKAAAKEADVAFAALDAPGFEFTKLLATFEGELISYAEAHAGKDPHLARLCLEKVLKISPDLERIRKKLAGLGLAAELSPDATRLGLFNGADLNDWSSEPTVWKVENGQIVARPGDQAFTANHKDKLSGEFTIDCELRVIEDTGSVPKCGVLFGWVGYGDFFSLHILKGHFLFCVRDAEHSTTLIQKDWVKDWSDFDAGKWNRYTLIVKDGTVTAFVNNRELLRYAVTKDRPTDGYVGVFVQRQSIAVRKYDLLK